MERPAKRQKLSPNVLSPCPTRTLDLAALQRIQPQRRTPGKVILPRIPEVTVTAGVLEVAVNDGSTGTEIPLPTAEVAVPLGTLGTVTLPELTPSWPSSSSTSQGSGQSTTPASNSSITSTEKTVTVTATSIFHVSYTNGTFIAPSRTRKTSPTDSDSGPDSDTNTTDSDASTFTYVFGQGVTDTYTPPTTDPTGGVYNNAVVGATATGSGPAPTKTNSDGGGGGGPSGPVLTPQQTQMVGGIVGGVAGTALILVVLLYVLRWYRQRLKSQGRLPEQLSSGHNSRDFGNLGVVGSIAARSQSSKSLFFPPAAMTSTKRLPGSDITMMTSTTSTSGAGSEKGFHRVSGRKISPVLSTGGDQYGGSYGAFEKDMAQPQTRAIARPRPDLSESSFYRDAEGAYVGNGTPASRSASTTPIYPFAEKTSHPPSLAHMASTSTHDFSSKDFNNTLARNTSKPEGVAVYRSSPARTPVTQSPNTSSIQMPIQAPVTMDEDIPEMPLPSPGIHLGLPVVQRRPSLLSSRSSGRFKEEI